ncbi:MAG: gliding motility protein GldM [Saprospiraceae bacterium]|jgi:gliding motility-associated protein GldM|nr:gliding motility protein GldM [Saprospiraceae bacterium]
MSIPKEPRQLMINVMYLVLTALLALNVSAEIFNAFEMVDKGLVKANDALDASNKDIPAQIKKSAEKGQQFKTYADRVDQVASISKEGSDYVNGIKSFLVESSGGYEEFEGKQVLKAQRDYDVTTRLLVDQGKGEELKNKMMEIKDKFLALVDKEDQAAFASKIPIAIDEETWQKSTNKKKNWSDFTFGHMPLGACMPIFSKFTNDIKSSEATVLNYLASKVGLTEEVVLDQFRVVSSPKKSYVIKGEKFETEVFLSASAGKTSNTGVKISVNGANLPVNEEGAAKWATTAGEVGVKKYEAVANVFNPVTKETKSFRQTFEYEVGERSVTISAAKMNVFYLGVDNPVEVSAAGVPSAQIKVSMTGGEISRNGDGTYTVRPSGAQGSQAVVSVSAPGMSGSKTFRIKRIPDPKPLLGGKEQPIKIGNGTFKGYSALIPILENFDFEAKCNLGGFTLVRVPKRLDAEFAPNRGARIEGQAATLQSKAVPGDRFIFQDIKCKCPGDAVDRNLGQLVFDIQ